MLSAEAKLKFALRLKELRERDDLSQKELGKALNLSQGTVGGWETSRREPTLLGLHELADFFNVSLDYLLGRTDAPYTVLQTTRSEFEVSAFEKRLLGLYRSLPESEQAIFCRMLRLEHPAEQRSKAKNA